MTELNKRLQAEIEHGKKIAENAEEIWNWETGAGKVRADKRAKHIANFLNLKPNDKVLEIGCGTGLFTEKISKLSGTKNILATDLSPELIEKAKEKYPHLNFEVGDAMNIEQEKETFDAIFGNSIVHHLDFDLFLKEMFRLLKPGGKMCFAEPNMLNPQIFVQKNIPLIKKWLGDSPDESAINRFSFKKQLQKKGFNNIQIIPFDFLHPSIPNALINPINFISNQLEIIPLVKEIGGSVIIYAEKV
jgi:ubiquinone/menaquinone biosynthesis C-methylase UbiE